MFTYGQRVVRSYTAKTSYGLVLQTTMDEINNSVNNAFNYRIEVA